MTVTGLKGLRARHLRGIPRRSRRTAPGPEPVEHVEHPEVAATAEMDQGEALEVMVIVMDATSTGEGDLVVTTGVTTVMEATILKEASEAEAGVEAPGHVEAVLVRIETPTRRKASSDLCQSSRCVSLRNMAATERITANGGRLYIHMSAPMTTCSRRCCSGLRS